MSIVPNTHRSGHSSDPYLYSPNDLTAGSCMLIRYPYYRLFVKGSYHSLCTKRILKEVLLVDDGV
jgi:hypothetical protein